MEGNESYIFFEEKPLGDAALGRYRFRWACR
jgi:hypothetical protein